MRDVYAYGVIAPSTLLELDGEFPAAGGYSEIRTVHRSMGGEAAGGAYVLARLGVATKLRGNRLSDDDASARVLEELSAAGVDTSAITVDPATAPVTEVVMSSGDERTVFGTYTRLLADRSWDPPDVDDIKSSRMVCLDPFFGEDSLLAARLSREAGVPYVTVDTPPDSEIAHFADALVISEEFAARILPGVGATGVLARYQEDCRGMVILTRGEAPFLHQRPGEPVDETAAFPVVARDTTGAGDSFRAGIVYGLLRGWDDERVVRTAAAIAALVCLSAPGVLGSPTVQQLEDFLTRQA